MPAPRLLQLVFLAAAALPVLTTLVGLDGWVPGAAAVIALVAAALYVFLLVRRPVVRWWLAVAIGLGAVATAVSHLGTEPLQTGVTAADLTRHFQQVMNGEYAVSVLLAGATAALTVGTVALPQFRRSVWLTAVACLVALVPVAVVAADGADQRYLLPSSVDLPALYWHVAPGLLATVLAGLALVLAVSRADRWFLLPAGVLLVQITTAYAAASMTSSWYLVEPVLGSQVSTAFLEPGMRVGVAATDGFALDLEIAAAAALAAVLLGPALIAAGAVRTADAPTAAPHPPPRPAEAAGPAAVAGPDEAAGSAEIAGAAEAAEPAGPAATEPDGTDGDAPEERGGPAGPREA